MKRFVSICLASLLMASAACHAAGKGESKGISVMSYNIRVGTANDGTNSWVYRGSASVEMISTQKPDVFGLQEAVAEQYRYLDFILEDYKSVGVGRDDGKKKGESMRIYYNKKTISLLSWGTFWLSETPDTPSKGWDADYPRTATWALLKDKSSGKKFYFVDTHIDHKGTEAQREGVKLILSRIASINKDSLPVVLVGDFNMTPDNPALDPVRKEMFNARDTAVNSDDLDTANDWGKKYSKIDYIWYKGFGSCIEYETHTKPYQGRTFISDHFPVKARLLF